MALVFVWSVPALARGPDFLVPVDHLRAHLRDMKLQPFSVGYLTECFILRFESGIPGFSIPDFDSGVAAGEDDIGAETDLAAVFLRQDEASLFVCRSIPGVGVIAAEKLALVFLGDVRVALDAFAESAEFLGRSDDEEAFVLLRKDVEILDLTAAPSHGHGDPILRIDRVPVAAGVHGMWFCGGFHGI